MTDQDLPAALAQLREEIAAIGRQIERGVPSANRDEVKRRIARLYKQVEGAVIELGAVREQIKALVDQFKQIAADEASDSPKLAALPPKVRADHLGASTFIEKGWSLISLGDHAAAVQALNRALQLAPGDIQAVSLLGWALMLGNEYDQALGAFSKVLAQEPANALARVNVGYICLKKRIFGEAIEHLSRAIRLDNDRKATLYAHYYLGLVYLERDMHLDAQTFLTKAIALGPNLVEAYYDLGRAQWFGGDPEGAKTTWRKGATANRFAPWAKRCQELLDSVERGEPVPRSSSAA